MIKNVNNLKKYNELRAFYKKAIDAKKYPKEFKFIVEINRFLNFMIVDYYIEEMLSYRRLFSQCIYFGLTRDELEELIDIVDDDDNRERKFQI